MLPDSAYFYLHSWCVPVKGVARGALCDFQRQDMALIPVELCEILETYNGQQIGALKADFDVEDHEILDEYFDFLAQKEFIALSYEPQAHFIQPVTTGYSVPSPIQSAILDLDQHSEYDLNQVILELCDLRCRYLQIRIYDEVEPSSLVPLFQTLKDSPFRHVELLLPFSNELEMEVMIGLRELHQSIDKLHFHGVPENIHLTLSTDPSVSHQIEPINSCEACGQISKVHFRYNQESYLLSKSFNNCLYKKIGVDVKGAIKNCPSSSKTYGLAGETPLQAVLTNPDFAIPGTIKKDDIEGCRQCEFRYVCTDCRVYVEEAGNAYSKPAKCNYDPVTATWHEQPVAAQPT